MNDARENRVREHVEKWRILHYDLVLPNGETVPGIPLEWIEEVLSEFEDARQ